MTSHNKTNYADSVLSSGKGKNKQPMEVSHDSQKRKKAVPTKTKRARAVRERQAAFYEPSQNSVAEDYKYGAAAMVAQVSSSASNILRTRVYEDVVLSTLGGSYQPNGAGSVISLVLMLLNPSVVFPSNSRKLTLCIDNLTHYGAWAHASFVSQQEILAQLIRMIDMNRERVLNLNPSNTTDVRESFDKIVRASALAAVGRLNNPDSAIDSTVKPFVHLKQFINESCMLSNELGDKLLSIKFDGSWMCCNHKFATMVKRLNVIEAITYGSPDHGIVKSTRDDIIQKSRAYHTGPAPASGITFADHPRVRILLRFGEKALINCLKCLSELNIDKVKQLCAHHTPDAKWIKSLDSMSVVDSSDIMCDFIAAVMEEIDTMHDETPLEKNYEDRYASAFICFYTSWAIHTMIFKQNRSTAWDNIQRRDKSDAKRRLAFGDLILTPLECDTRILRIGPSRVEKARTESMSIRGCHSFRIPKLPQSIKDNTDMMRGMKGYDNGRIYTTSYPLTAEEMAASIHCFSCDVGRYVVGLTNGVRWWLVGGMKCADNHVDYYVYDPGNCFKEGRGGMWYYTQGITSLVEMIKHHRLVRKSFYTEAVFMTLADNWDAVMNKWNEEYRSHMMSDLASTDSNPMVIHHEPSSGSSVSSSSSGPSGSHTPEIVYEDDDEDRFVRALDEHR